MIYSNIYVAWVLKITKIAQISIENLSFNLTNIFIVLNILISSGCITLKYWLIYCSAKILDHHEWLKSNEFNKIRLNNNFM